MPSSASAPSRPRRWPGMRARLLRHACRWRSGRTLRIWTGHWCRYPALASTGKIPQLAVMFNNRGYHQEVMHVQRLSNFRNRVANLGNDMGPVGTSIQNPDIEYHKLAESMGWWAKGPIKDPAELGPAIKEAVAVVKSGQPALLNVWTQPR